MDTYASGYMHTLRHMGYLFIDNSIYTVFQKYYLHFNENTNRKYTKVSTPRSTYLEPFWKDDQGSVLSALTAPAWTLSHELIVARVSVFPSK